MIAKYLPILIIVLASIEHSFKPSTINVSNPTNDTTDIIKICVRYAFDSSRMPGLSTATKKYKFGDSILFTSENIPLKYLPTEVDSFKFKILSLKNICSILLADSDWEKRPNYISIRNFEKKDNTFNIIIESHNCGRVASGGGLYLTIKKDNDSFKITYSGGFSID